MCPISDAHVQIFLGNLFGRATHPVQTSQQSFCTATKKDYAKKDFPQSLDLGHICVYAQVICHVRLEGANYSSLPH